MAQRPYIRCFEGNGCVVLGPSRPVKRVPSHRGTGLSSANPMGFHRFDLTSPFSTG
jgi:hypothetical protein